MDTVRTDSYTVAQCNAFCNCIYVSSSDNHIVTNNPSINFWIMLRVYTKKYQVSNVTLIINKIL